MTKVTVKWDGEKIARSVGSAVDRATLKTAQDILADSNTKVPYDTGALKSSGKVVKDQDGVSVAYFESYAGEVHESPASFKNGKQNKFLESAIKNHIGRFESALKESVQGELR